MHLQLQQHDTATGMGSKAFCQSAEVIVSPSLVSEKIFSTQKDKTPAQLVLC